MLSHGLSPWHLLLLLAVVILVFGSKKLPDVARGLGQSMRILKAESKAMKEDGKSTSGATASSGPMLTGSAAASASAPAAERPAERAAEEPRQQGTPERAAGQA